MISFYIKSVCFFFKSENYLMCNLLLVSHYKTIYIYIYILCDEHIQDILVNSNFGVLFIFIFIFFFGFNNINYWQKLMSSFNTRKGNSTRIVRVLTLS